MQPFVILQAFIAEQKQELARRWITPEQMIMLVVGNADRIRTEIEQLVRRIVELDASAVRKAEPINRWLDKRVFSSVDQNPGAENHSPDAFC